jgi:hypothetical protein
MATNENQTSWPDFAEGLYERLTGRGAAIRYQFDDMQVDVPNSTGSDAARATWTLSGGLTITTSEPGH